MQGFVQIYTGDGKGKTTAALGLALRAAGAGLRVYFGQFIKNGDYSELTGLARFGVDTACPFQLLLSLRRMGARRLEALFGAGQPDLAAPGGRAPVVAATILSELAEMADHALEGQPAVRDLSGLRVAIQGLGKVGYPLAEQLHAAIPPLFTRSLAHLDRALGLARA